MVSPTSRIEMSDIPRGSSVSTITKTDQSKYNSLARKRCVLGLGSVRRDERDRRTLKSERAGDQFCFNMSMQIPPRSETFMWYILRGRLSVRMRTAVQLGTGAMHATAANAEMNHTTQMSSLCRQTTVADLPSRKHNLRCVEPEETPSQCGTQRHGRVRAHGYSFGSSIANLNIPPSYGLPVPLVRHIYMLHC